MKRNKTEVTELLTGIPDELLIIEILANKLDVKTLSACACVSKWWNKTLHSHEFIDAHRQHHHRRRSSDQLLFVVPNTHHEFIRIERLEDAQQISPVCNDLVCVAYVESIRVCNFWTGRFVELPSAPVEPDPVPWYMNQCTSVVFGYLESLGKYFVIAMRSPHPEASVHKLCFNQSSSSSEWKWETIKHKCPRRVRHKCPRGFRHYGTYVHDSVYWLIDFAFWNQSEEENELIVSLNVETEEFGIIKHPQTSQWESFPMFNHLVTLIDLQGMLCLTNQGKGPTRGLSAPVFEVWALKRELGQWEMVYNVKLDSLGMQLAHRALKYGHVSSMKGELILESQENGTWYIYNPVTNGLRTITGPRTPVHFSSGCMLLASFFVQTWPPTKLR